MRFRRSAALLAALALVALTLPAAVGGVPSGSSGGKFTRGGTYIVQLADLPVVAYEGGVAGLKGTAPTNGKKIDPIATDVTKYVAYLTGKHDKVLASVGATAKLYDYVYSFNGMAARLTAAQANRLVRTAGVVAVTPDTKRRLDTSSTPAFLGLSGTDGTWSKLGGIDNAGEGMVVGIIDSGIWPESLSFSDRTGLNGNATKDGKLSFQQVPGWHGKCTPGEAFPASLCNQKLVGAQWFNRGFGGDAGVKHYFPFEFASTRDADGHGTHTASTAAGNARVEAVIGGNSLGMISGMAPRARVAAYKVCWGADEGGCFSSDSMAAIDQAVADGVDAINYSISGNTVTTADAVSISFLFAARAGIIVSASAGNSGPDESTVNHGGPWLMTVAAGTKDREFRATVVLGNGTTYAGIGNGAAVPSAPLVLAADVAAAGADPDDARRCYASIDGGLSLDPAKTAGKIVVCDRGGNNRTSKSLAVKEAGGVGMVLTNTSVNSLNADIHYVPTVHLAVDDRAAIRAYAATAGATASLTAGTPALVAAPEVAGFSSRGPIRSAGSNILKPDIMAPGVDVLAAVSPVAYGRNFDFYSGTSMAAPHMTGIAALMRQAHPGWSASAIKSALMTTASTRDNAGQPIDGGPFDFGAGQVVPTSALDPGLVYESGWNSWLAFLCGSEPGVVGISTCDILASRGYSFDPSELNYPSIAVSSLAGVKTIHRTVTNVTKAAETYTINANVPGFDVSVAGDATFTIQPGKTQAIALTFTRTTAALNEWATGSLVLTGDRGHVVNSPIVLRPVALAAPAEFSFTADGASYPIVFGYTGSFSATPRGLVAAEVTSGTLPSAGGVDFEPGVTGSTSYEVTIPAGTSLARFQLFETDVAPGSDFDLFVYFDGEEVGRSAGGTANERIDLADPDPGTYTVYVHNWASETPTSPFKLYHWILGTASAGNLSVTAPASATLGGSGTISLTTSGLMTGTKYLGAVVYGGGAASTKPTIVRVDIP